MINEDRVEGHILFNAFFLDLSNCKDHVSSTLHPGLKPHCASGRHFSDMVISLFKITRVKILPAIESREILL